MLAQPLLNCSNIMLEKPSAQAGHIKKCGRFSKQIVTLNYVLFVKKRRIDLVMISPDNFSTF